LSVTRRNADGALVLVGKGDDPNFQGGPQNQISSSDDMTHVVDGVIPITADLKLNGLRTADQLTLEFEYRDLPVDPRAVRACAIEYFLGNVRPDDFARGVRGELRSDAARGGIALPANVVQATYTDDFGRERSNLRFRGWADRWTIEWNSDDVPVARLECTDNTRLLLEQDAAPKLTINPKTPIDQAIADYLTNYPLFRGLAVLFSPAGTKVPTLGEALSKTKYQPKLGPNVAGGDKLKVWDYLTDVVTSIGYLIWLDDLTITIQQPRTYYSSQFSTRGDDPFRGRVLPSGRLLAHRTLVYGVNVVDQHVERNYTKHVPQNIELRCYSKLRKKTLVARFPNASSRNKWLLPGNSADEKWTVKIVHDIEDEKALRRIAQSIYEQQGRREIEARVTTKNLGSYGGGPGDPDLLDARPGDPIDLEIKLQSTGIDKNTMTDIAEAVSSNAEQRLIELGFSPGFAKAYQRSIGNIGFPRGFILRNYAISWDKVSESVKLELGLMNYTEVNMSKDLPEGEEPQPGDAAPGAEPVQVIINDTIG
jgi:hypothetical protein